MLHLENKNKAILVIFLTIPVLLSIMFYNTKKFKIDDFTEDNIKQIILHSNQSISSEDDIKFLSIQIEPSNVVVGYSIDERNKLQAGVIVFEKEALTNLYNLKSHNKNFFQFTENIFIQKIQLKNNNYSNIVIINHNDKVDKIQSMDRIFRIQNEIKINTNPSMEILPLYEDGYFQIMDNDNKIILLRDALFRIPEEK